MRHLRNLSARPRIVVDQRNRSIGDPQRERVGIDGPWGRERVVFALPLGEPPHDNTLAVVVRDEDAAQLADPDGNLVGFEKLWIPRLLTARWTEDTRRLAG